MLDLHTKYQRHWINSCDALICPFPGELPCLCPVRSISRVHESLLKRKLLARCGQLQISICCQAAFPHIHPLFSLCADKQQEVDIPTPSTETPPSAEAANLPPTPATPKAAAAVQPSSAPSSAVEKAPVARKFSDEEGTAQRRNRVNVSDVS